MKKYDMVAKTWWKFKVGAGYRIDSSNTMIQIAISRNEVAIRIDILFGGIYIGFSPKGRY